MPSISQFKVGQYYFTIDPGQQWWFRSLDGTFRTHQSGGIDTGEIINSATRIENPERGDQPLASRKPAGSGAGSDNAARRSTARKVSRKK